MLFMQKQVSDLKVENRNLRRLLLCQSTTDRPVKDGLRSFMSFRERGSTAIRPPDFRLSLTDSLSSLCDLPATKLSLKYSLTDLRSSGQCCYTLCKLHNWPYLSITVIWISLPCWQSTASDGRPVTSTPVVIFVVNTDCPGDTSCDTAWPCSSSHGCLGLECPTRLSRQLLLSHHSTPQWRRFDVSIFADLLKLTTCLTLTL